MDLQYILTSRKISLLKIYFMYQQLCMSSLIVGTKRTKAKTSKLPYINLATNEMTSNTKTLCDSTEVAILLWLEKIFQFE